MLNINKENFVKPLLLSLAFVTASANATENLQKCRAEKESLPENRFTQHIITTDDGDFKVVNDATTGLQWSYCFLGQQLDGDRMNCVGKPEVPYEYIDSEFPDIRAAIMESVRQKSQLLDRDMSSWRLPNIKELLTIYNESCNPATYSAFSYKINVSEDEIKSLIETRLNANSWNDYNQQAHRQETGKAYRNYTVVSDTPIQDDDHKYYYTINFNHWILPIDKDRNTSGLIRLVREIPKQ